MQHHASTTDAVRQDVVRATALYGLRHGIHWKRAHLPRKYAPRYRHDMDGHADEDVFLAALAAHPNITRLERTTPAEDELLGVDALVTVQGEQNPVPIDFTTRGRGCRGYTANLLDTLRRGVIPIVMEHVPTALPPSTAYAAFAVWRAKGEEFLTANALRRQADDQSSPAPVAISY